MRRLTSRLFTSFLLLLLPWEAGAGNPPKQIGILMFSGEMRYEEAVQGFKDHFVKSGLDDSKVVFSTVSGDANRARVAELVTRFISKKYDLILTLGTSATVAIAREIADTPIVFSTVYDPVQANIAKSWKSSGNNTTGTSSYLSMTQILKALRLFAPAKRLAVLYTHGEQNSEIQLRDLQKLSKQFAITVVPVPITTMEDITHVLPEVFRNTDSVYITGSNFVSKEVALIVELAARAKVVSITHLEDLVKKGVLLGVCFDFHRMGSIAGAKAIQIFNGTRPSAIPIDRPRDYDLVINMKTAERGGFSVPPGFLTAVKRKIQ